MQDLNDLALYAAVVRHKGFTAAANALSVPKSKISKRIAALEEQLGVRLIERSTRKLAITDIGQSFYERCEAVLSGVEAAEAVGVEIDYSCRVGTCGTCVVPLKSGTVTMEVEEGLPPEEKAKGIILACQAKSVGNLVVEA